MGFFKKLFSSSNNESVESKQQQVTLLPKKDFKVYPRIKNGEAANIALLYNIPLGGDLVLTFVQDINDRISYVTKEEVPDNDLMQQVSRWNENIKGVDFDLFSPDSWGNRVFFNEPGDYSNEKVFDSEFIKKACELLNTDKLIISISRRHRMQITSYHEDFPLLEDFFWSHFSIWRNPELDDEVVTEMVLLAEKDRVTHIVPLGFRMNMYEDPKTRQRQLNYSTMEEIISDGKLDFQDIIDRNKIAINPELIIH